jgi:AraC-like DNA-binding protein
MDRLRAEVECLRAEVERLTSMNVSLAAASERLLERNVDLYERMDSYYNVRMHVDWLKNLIKRHREYMANADLRDDDELQAMIEAIAHDAGFATVRTLNRKIQDSLGITPGEFRVMTHPDD